MEPALIFGIIAALISPILGYLAASRKLSGRIDTSTAAELWNEAGSMRAEYRHEIEELRDLVTKLRARVEELEKKNEALYLENGNLKRMIEGHEQTIAELRHQVHNLSDENVALRKENSVLRERVTELEGHERA